MKKPISPRSRGGFFSPAVKIIVVITLFLSWYSCVEPDEIGLDLIDEEADYFTTDTVTVNAFSLPDDSIPTNFGSQNLLGIIQDPVFGKMRASVYTEFRLPQNNLSLGEDPVLDSVRLSIAYTGRYYGNENSLQRIRVYELSENISDADTLYTNTTAEYYPDAIGTLRLRTAPRDSIIVDTLSTLPAHFIVPLSMEFGQKIIDANDTTFFENIPNFLEYFKGLYITVEDHLGDEGSIYNLSMGSTYTALQLYYRNEEDTVSQVQNFYISEFAQRITYVENFEYEEAHPLLKAQVIEGQTDVGDSLLFLQSLGSLRANIDLPYIEDLSAVPGIAINRAQLIVPVEPELVDSVLFPPAERLLVFSYTEDGEMEQLSDISIGSGYFGGFYDQEEEEYVFNITSYLQQVLNGEIEYHGLTMVISGAAENARRVVLKGPGREEDPMRLEIVYTIFE